MSASPVLLPHPVPSSPAPSSPGSASPASAASPERFAIVGIGASAGGLLACQRLLGAMQDDTGMAFILVQHLPPDHPSLMVDLLAHHTRMRVVQASEGMPIAANTLYAIPPGVYLAVADGTLHLSEPDAPHGARLPVDFLFRSLAACYADRAVGVVLTGTGADGSLGLEAIHRHGGLLIAQAPDEAEYGGMPTAAIATGAVDLVLPIAGIPEALTGYNTTLTEAPARTATSTATSTAHQAEPRSGEDADLVAIITLMRSGSAHDFTLYKPGTLQRRIERRMGMVGLAAADTQAYLAMLRQTPAELDLLARDLLIHVTSFFRDPKVFELLAEQTLPALVRSHDTATPLRVWVAGCSTGEESYSLAMLLHEAIASSGITLKLQIFASALEPDAVPTARDGLYPFSIAAQISPERLACWFTREPGGFRVTPELRGTVVFTVQDLLSDPPFSRLDLISCRNVLIYLRPEAQARVISLFHFALHKDGVLLLGNAETIATQHGYFSVLDKPARLYRHTARSLPGETDFAIGRTDAARMASRPARSAPAPATLPEACRRLVLEAYAPAAVLINGRHEVLYSLGPVDRYLRMATGQPSLDVLAMARPGMRAQLQQAIREAGSRKAFLISGEHVTLPGEVKSFDIQVHRLPGEAPDLLLLCFVDVQQAEPTGVSHLTDSAGIVRIGELEHELEVTRAELHSAIRNLEISGEQQAAVNQEAQSVNEEYQSTNEELLASKEELQSLNEELTALNGQLQETLDRQRATSNDLQNVLYSTDVATLFLDLDLRIRFFTPATRLLFNVIQGDIGRPLTDLHSLAIDRSLAEDARAVIAGQTVKDREIQLLGGAWHHRRMLPYRTHEGEVAGVVMTFTDITERKNVAKSLEAARQEAEIANRAKSRFLAAASHDLRQPLQTLALLQGVLARTVESSAAKALVLRQDETLSGISSMLNALLDINEIETGNVHAETVEFPINTLLSRMQEVFGFHAEAQGLVLRVVPCSVVVRTDPRLLEQMLRNLMSNAMKYTRTGRVLLGCRRHPGMVSIEVWDTGVGIPERELLAIFQEYHQLDNAARSRSRGLGLGLSIVQRLAEFLGHRVLVTSTQGKGSVFRIQVQIPAAPLAAPAIPAPPVSLPAARLKAEGAGVTILVIEDDPSVRDLLALLLDIDGHSVTSVADGAAALALVETGQLFPVLILTDYNLPGHLDGVETTVRLRAALRRSVPAIVLTGDISKETLRKIARHDCLQLNKPIKPAELSAEIARMLQHPAPLVLAEELPMPTKRGPPLTAADPLVTVIDDDPALCAALRLMLETEGYHVQTHGSAEAFLEAGKSHAQGCLLIDEGLPGMSGMDLLRRLTAQKHHLPAIMITGQSNVAMAVEAMKCGAADFIDKPVGAEELLASVARALAVAKDASKVSEFHDAAAAQVAGLTRRQREIMDLVLAGHPSKNIAADLKISQRTVENHRAAIMRKTRSRSLPALARLAMAAGNDVS
jgi:two-component system CheB/CheR fusion protein